MSLLTEQMVRKAIDQATPTIWEILKDPDCVWGPKYVAIEVKGPHLRRSIVEWVGIGVSRDQFGVKLPRWEKSWGSETDFSDVAHLKFIEAESNKKDSALVSGTCPWCLDEGDTLHAGAIYRDGLTIAVSGAKSPADVAIAEVIFAIISMYCHLKVRQLRDKKENVSP